MPLPRVSASPNDAAAAARILRTKSPLLPTDFARLDSEAKKRAVTVTDEVSLDAIRSMREALAKAKADGIEYREFVKTVGPTLHAQWGVDSPQLKTIFVNNVQQAANQAIVARLNRQRSKYPYWTLDIVKDEVTSATCGYFITHPLVLPAGHPWFAKNAPMRHHRCRTTLRGLTTAEARKIGITKTPPNWPPQEGWGGSAPMGEYKATMKDAKVKADNGQGDVHADRPVKVRKKAKLASKPKLQPKAPKVKGKLVGMPPRRGLSFRFARHGTSIEVRHMSDRTIQCPSVDIDVTTLADDAGPVDATPKRVWNQLAKVGTFRGHPSGPFELTTHIFDEIVRNFRATQNQRIPIDFEHASEQDPTSGSIPTEGAPAQGWITDLENRGMGGLWGLVELLEPARGYVRTGKYKYFSPAIRFGSKDRVTGQPIGARMTSGALTNNPFLDGMMPLAASDRGTGASVNSTETIQMKLGEYEFDAADVMPKLRMGLFGTGTHQAEMATGAECYDALCRLEAAYADCVAEAPGAEPMLVQSALKRLRESMNLGMGVTVPEMIALVKQIVEHMIGEHVEELHPDETPASSRDMRDTNMDENVLKLRDAESKVVTLTAKVTEYETKVAGLELQLADRNSKVATLETELKTLRDDAAKRAEADETAAIELAFATYKDTHKLTETHKKSMLLTYRHDRATFDTLYPPVAPDQRHLQRTLSARKSPAAQSNGVPPVAAPPAFMLNQNAWASGNAHAVGVQAPMQQKREYAERIAMLTEEKVRKGIPREQATVEARRELTQAPPVHT
jgi:hypothetical protein